MNDDTVYGTDNLRYFAGAKLSEQQDKTEKVRKSFELMRLLGGR